MNIRAFAWRGWTAGAWIVLAAAGLAAAPVPPPVVLRASDRGGELQARLKVKQTLQVCLPGNPTTGYQWQLVKDPPVTILYQTDSPQYAGDQPDRVGAPGIETYTFEAVGRGLTTVRWTYRRPWETNSPPARTVTLIVTVQ